MTAVSGTYEELPHMIATVRDGRVRRAFRTRRYEAQLVLSVVFMALFLPFSLSALGGHFSANATFYNLSQLGCMPDDS